MMMMMMMNFGPETARVLWTIGFIIFIAQCFRSLAAGNSVPPLATLAEGSGKCHLKKVRQCIWPAEVVECIALSVSHTSVLTLPKCVTDLAKEPGDFKSFYYTEEKEPEKSLRSPAVPFAPGWERRNHGGGCRGSSSTPEKANVWNNSTLSMRRIITSAHLSFISEKSMAHFSLLKGQNCFA